MSYSAPLEMLADAAGSVTFGWADEGVYYARFSRCLSAKLGQAFAARLRVAVEGAGVVKYFADARSLESYDLLARSAFVRVVTEHRRKFAELCLLAWDGGEINPAFVNALGQPLSITKDPIAFEARLSTTAPRARIKLGSKPDSSHRSRWGLRR
jgi:hypothetical protein